MLYGSARACLCLGLSTTCCFKRSKEAVDQHDHLLHGSVADRHTGFLPHRLPHCCTPLCATQGCGCATCYYAWGGQASCNKPAPPGVRCGMHANAVVYKDDMAALAQGPFVAVNSGAVGWGVAAKAPAFPRLSVTPPCALSMCCAVSCASDFLAFLCSPALHFTACAMSGWLHCCTHCLPTRV